MIITYLRSSSYNNFDFCQMQYFLNYVLGIPQQSGHKADKGTIVHKAMECLAVIKKEFQDNPAAESVTIVDDALGEYTCSLSSLLTPYQMTDDEVDRENKTRKNKYTYKVPCQIPYSHIRYGVDLVKDILRRSFDHYSDKYDHHDWKPVDKKDCYNWTWMALDYLDGLYDPRKRTIVEAEPHFDIKIDKPWAEYYYELPNGKEIFGNLAAKGTVDLVTEVEPGVLEVVDWKTGQRLDWTSKKSNDKKDIKKLHNDPQLMLYYYALSHLYPDVDYIILTIFFIRDGGPFTVCFEPSKIEAMEARLRKRFEQIRNCNMPKMLSNTQSHFKCTRLCHYYKNNFPGSEKNICRFIHDELKDKGIDEVTKLYTHEGHNVSAYEAPGE